ncbi:hypothetical protein [Microvirga calopogonii]|uniref:hypothetical protein n=1 Tax=Microvirga calopogonii TaxID=2078013 RepID=UPI000E0DFD98|nr:hypothetical protein [Microvirga calopogonii]
MSSQPKKTPSEAAAEARRKARLAAGEAVEALRQVFLNPDAPAPARATAATTVVRIAGLFEKDENGDRKQPHEMSAEELQTAIDRLKREASGDIDEEGENGLFD